MAQVIKMMESSTDTLEALYQLVLQRKSADPQQSYVAKLFKKGRHKIAQKLGEEAVETAIAAVAEGKKEVVSESADLLFHLLVLWASCGVRVETVMEELVSRAGTSGIEEKQKRKRKL